jgi:hypothetical protein
MATLAQYSATLNAAPQPRVQPAGSLGSRLFGAAIVVATIGLVLAAAIQSA